HFFFGALMINFWPNNFLFELLPFFFNFVGNLSGIIPVEIKFASFSTNLGTACECWSSQMSFMNSVALSLFTGLDFLPLGRDFISGFSTTIGEHVWVAAHHFVCQY